MNLTHETEHARFRRSVGEYLLDLLEEQDGAWIEAHARECEPCGRLLAGARAARADWWEGAGHPPVPLLSAFGHRPDSLTESDRALVQGHVAGCEECRADLIALSGVAAEATAGLSAPQAPQAPTRFRPRGVIWAAAGSVAAALALVLFARQQSSLSQSASSQPPQAPQAPPTVPSATEPTAQVPDAGTGPAISHAARPTPVTMAAVEIAGPTRGEAAAATGIVVPAGAREIPVTLPALFIAEGVTVRVELRRADGAMLSRQEIPVAQALRRGGVRLPAAHLSSGRHTLRVAWLDATTGDEAREYPLELIVNH